MTLGRIGLFAAMVAIIGYIGFHITTLLSPPALELSLPAQGLTTSSHIIEIMGKTAPGARVEINGTPLPPTKEGLFRHTLVVNDGINTILVKAQKRHSRARLIERQIFILGENKISKTAGAGI